jgi:hypothetical protein
MINYAFADGKGFEVPNWGREILKCKNKFTSPLKIIRFINSIIEKKSLDLQIVHEGII